MTSNKYLTTEVSGIYFAVSFTVSYLILDVIKCPNIDTFLKNLLAFFLRFCPALCRIATNNRNKISTKNLEIVRNNETQTDDIAANTKLLN